jgi:heme-degrading monooxygenase HmoA
LSQIGKVDATRGPSFVTDGTARRALCDAAAMVLEIADFAILPGREEAFTAAYREGVAQLHGSPGFRSVRITRGIESPSRFMLLVEWDDLEAHTVGFRESERFTRWREIVGPFFDGPPKVEHFADAAAAG